jgi:hypothetical protein
MNPRSLYAFQLWSVLSMGFAALDCHEMPAQTGVPQVLGTLQAESAQTSGSDRRLHPGYTVFAAQLSLPRITVANERSLEIGGVKQLDFSGSNQNQATRALADQLQVPVAALNGLGQKLSADTHLKGKELADAFRNALIDYKFLEDRWNRFHPPGVGLEVKTRALNALSAGDIDRAWALFDGLARPRPPEGLRVVETH